jgi:PAS domain S-box-containing protein
VCASLTKPGCSTAQSRSVEMKTTSGSNRNLQLGFGSAILALLIFGAAPLRGLVASSASTRWVRHTYEVLENLEDLRFAMDSIDSSGRPRAAPDQAGLRNLTADNAPTQRQLPALEPLAAQQIQEAERVITLRRGQGMEAAADALRGEAGQSREVGLHPTVLQLQVEERRLLELRSEDARRRMSQTRSVLVLGTLLGLLIAAAAGWSLQRRNSGRGQAEEALRDSEEQYRMLLDGVQDHAIFMLDPQGRIVSWNAGAERIQGYSAEQVIGRNFSCLFPAEDIQRGRPRRCSPPLPPTAGMKNKACGYGRMAPGFWPMSPAPHCATRWEGCAASQKSAAILAKARRRERSTAGCWKRPPMPWWW